MLAQCEKGKKLDNGFKAEVWREIMEEFNKGAIEEKKTVQQLKTRMNSVRTFLILLLLNYKNVYRLIGNIYYNSLNKSGRHLPIC